MKHASRASAPSKVLLTLAGVLFFIVALAPLLVTVLEVDGEDIADLFDPRTLALLGRTLWMGLAVAVGAILVGAPYGFFVARTNIPGAEFFRVAGMLPLLMPSLMIAMTWAVILPDLRGATATILMLVLATFPLVSLFCARAFERIDARQEEAALLVGGWRAVLRADLALVFPAILTGAALAFTFAVNDFAVPDYVSSVGPKFNVYADEIKLNWDQLERPGKPVATAIPMILLALVTLVPALRMRRAGAMSSLAGDFKAPATIQLGKGARVAATLFCIAVLACGAFIPLCRLFYEGSGLPAAFREGTASFAGAIATFQKECGTALEQARNNLRASMLFSLGAALIAVPIGAVLGHAIERSRSRVRASVVESLTLLPIAAPAILFGIGTITLWNRDVTAGFYDSQAMPLVLFVGRYVAFATLLASGAVAMLDPKLEEAATLSGAGPIARFVHIVVPALKGTWIGAFVLVFVFTMRDLDAAIIVPAANKMVMMRVFNGVHFGRDSYVACLSLLVVFATVMPGLLWTLFARKRLEVLP